MKKRHLIIAVLSLALVSGCGASEPTTTQATTEATTESLYTNESDKTIASLATDNHPNFSWLNSLTYWEGDNGVIVSANVKWGDEYIKACKFLISQLKTADYFKDAGLTVEFKQNDAYFECFFAANDGYEHAMIRSANTDEPIYDVTIEELEEAIKEANTTEGGD